MYSTNGKHSISLAFLTRYTDLLYLQFHKDTTPLKLIEIKCISFQLNQTDYLSNFPFSNLDVQALLLTVFLCMLQNHIIFFLFFFFVNYLFLSVKMSLWWVQLHDMEWGFNKKILVKTISVKVLEKAQ